MSTNNIYSRANGHQFDDSGFCVACNKDFMEVEGEVCANSVHANTEPTRELAQVDPNSYEWLDKLVEDDCRQDIDSSGDECNVVTELFIADLKAKHEAEVTAARNDERFSLMTSLSLHLMPILIHTTEQDFPENTRDLLLELHKWQQKTFKDAHAALKNQQGECNGL